MAKKTITFGLSEASIDAAIKELKNYQKEIEDKTDEFRRRVAEKLTEYVEIGFQGAVVDEMSAASVYVTQQSQGNVELVIASGEDAVWVEFGAGVHYNGASGSYPNPWGSEIGEIVAIGTYGKGYGSRQTWAYKDESGEKRITHGTAAVMPMYNAVQSISGDLEDIAKEVFG